MLKIIIVLSITFILLMRTQNLKSFICEIENLQILQLKFEILEENSLLFISKLNLHVALDVCTTHVPGIMCVQGV